MVDKQKIDFNEDGVLSGRELDNAERALEIELREEKANTQKRMAWVSLFAMLFFTVILFIPALSNERVKVLSDVLGLFYIAQAGIVGAYMGVTAWMSSRATSNSSYGTNRFSSFRGSSYGDFDEDRPPRPGVKPGIKKPGKIAEENSDIIRGGE